MSPHAVHTRVNAWAAPPSRRDSPCPGRAWGHEFHGRISGSTSSRFLECFNAQEAPHWTFMQVGARTCPSGETVFRPKCPITVSRARTLAYSSEPSNDGNAFVCRSTRKRCETGSVRWVTRWQHTRRWRASPCCPARRLPISPRDASVPSPDDDNLVVSDCMERGLSGRVRLKVRRVRSYGWRRALSIILGQRNSAMTGSFCFVLQSW